MPTYQKMTRQERGKEYALLQEKYREILTHERHFDMTRGKPCQEQLDMVSDIFDMLQEPDD